MGKVYRDHTKSLKQIGIKNKSNLIL